MSEIRLLGHFAVQVNGKRVDVPSLPARLLLAYLVLNANKAVMRDKLAGVLWPDTSEAGARKNLRQALWRLRKAIGERQLISDNNAIKYKPSPSDFIDVSELRSPLPESPGADTLIEVLKHYSGHLMPGYYDEWIVRERDHLKAVFENRVEQLLELLAEEKRWRKLREWAERWLSLGEFPEPAYQALMRAHAGLKDMSGIASTYQRCVNDLKGGLGLPPSAATQELYEKLVESQPERASPGLRAYGAEWSYVLPLPTSPFIGRKRELAELGQLLNEGHVRLVTLVGPGGIGKTRLALQVAATKMNFFVHGLHFIPLSQVRSAEEMIVVLADTLGLNLLELLPPKQQILDYLREKEILLLFDNFEHILEAAHFVVEILKTAPRVTVMVTSREKLGLGDEHVYQVSALRVPNGETGASGQAEAVQMFMAYARRARPGYDTVAFEQALIADICRLVGGMPLAIELAASWMSVLSAQEIADSLQSSLDILERNLRGIPQRQRSMRAVFDQSWGLLNETERQALRRLSVFHGGFSAQAVASVAGATVETLTVLAEKSLLQPEQRGRYSFHELLHRYVRERLAEEAEEEVALRHRHALYFLSFLQRQFRNIQGPDVLLSFKAIEADLENIRIAWDWSWAEERFRYLIPKALDGSFEDVWEVFACLLQFASSRNLYSLGRHFFAHAADALEEEGPGGEGLMLEHALTLLAKFLPTPEQVTETALRAWRMVRDLPADGPTALIKVNLLADLSPAKVPPKEAEQHLWQAIEAGRSGDEAWLHGLLVGAAGHLFLFNLNRPIEARPLLEESEDQLGKIGEHFVRRITIAALGNMALLAGQFEAAAAYYQEGIRIAERLEAEDIAVTMQLGLGKVNMYKGRYQQAKRLFQNGLATAIDLGSHSRIIQLYCLLSQAASHAGNFELAEKSLASAQERIGSSGVEIYGLEVSKSRALLRYLQGQLAEAEETVRQALARAQQPDQRIDRAELLGLLAEVHLSQTRLAEAVEVAEQSLQTCVETGALTLASNVVCTMAEIAQLADKTKLASELAIIGSTAPSTSHRDAERLRQVLNASQGDLSPQELQDATARAERSSLEKVLAGYSDMLNTLRESI